MFAARSLRLLSQGKRRSTPARSPRLRPNDYFRLARKLHDFFTPRNRKSGAILTVRRARNRAVARRGASCLRARRGVRRCAEARRSALRQLAAHRTHIRDEPRAPLLKAFRLYTNSVRSPFAKFLKETVTRPRWKAAASGD